MALDKPLNLTFIIDNFIEVEILLQYRIRRLAKVTSMAKIS